jgi:hypothetical protein
MTFLMGFLCASLPTQIFMFSSLQGPLRRRLIASDLHSCARMGVLGRNSGIFPFGVAWIEIVLVNIKNPSEITDE